MSKLRLNDKNPSIKRILRELKDLKDNPSDQFLVEALEDNLFDIHFTILGPQGTEFENGRYHGRIVLPNEYPFKPPNIMLLTPNGRFQLFTKICLSITGYHPEFWQPAWGIRTVLVALISFLNEKAEGAIGGIDTSKEERQRLAKLSLEWECNTCNAKLNELELKYSDSNSESDKDDELVKLLKFSPEKPKDELKSVSDKSVIKEDNQINQSNSGESSKINSVVSGNSQSNVDEVNVSIHPVSESVVASTEDPETRALNPIANDPKPSPSLSPVIQPTNNSTGNGSTQTEKISTRTLDILIIVCLAILLYYIRALFIK